MTHPSIGEQLLEQGVVVVSQIAAEGEADAEAGTGTKDGTPALDTARMRNAALLSERSLHYLHCA